MTGCFNARLLLLMWVLLYVGKRESTTVAAEPHGQQKDKIKTCSKWDIQSVPSFRNPFIFIHQRKSGGTSLRKVIFEAAKLKVAEHSILIPCHTRPCTTWDWDHFKQRFTVLGGHFSWATIFRSYWQVDGSNGIQRFVGKSDTSCLTNFRHPVERAWSCLFFRHGKAFKMAMENTKTAGEKLAVVKSFLHMPSKYGFGCNNEAIRMLSGFSDEEMINSLNKTDNPDLYNTVVKAAIQNMEHCAIVLMKSQVENGANNLRLLSYFFPWINASSLPFLNGNLVKTQEIPPDINDLIMQENEAEFEVYEAALSQYNCHLSKIAT